MNLMIQPAHMRRLHKGGVVSCVLCVLLALILSVVASCTLTEPPTSTAIGHSYTRSEAGNYISRDDDGDVDEVQVDVIASLRDNGVSSRALASTIEQSELQTRYRAAENETQQIQQVKNAISSYSRIIVIPRDALSSSHSWDSVLQLARHKGIPVVLSDDSCDVDNSTTNIPIAKIYYAAIFESSEKPHNLGNGQTSEETTSVFDAIMTVIEDRPHDTVFSISMNSHDNSR